MLEALAAHLDTIAALAPTWGLVFVFTFMAVESSFIPFPSEVVMIPAGFLAARGELSCGSPWADLALAVAVGTLGALAGAFFNYWLSAKLGEPFLRKYGRWFFLKEEALDRAEEVFNRYGAATTFVCRLLPVIRQLISIPAGLSRMPLGSFALFTALGAGIWNAVLAATGFWLGRTAGDLPYAELVARGKTLAGEHLPAVVAGAVGCTLAYALVSRLAMRRRHR